jgi:hypothetical protein
MKIRFSFTELVLLAGFMVSLQLLYIRWPLGVVGMLVVAAMAILSFKKGVITVDPPIFARTTVWDALWPAVIRPRVVFVAEFFPIWEKLILIDRTPTVRAEENQLVFKNVRTKADPNSGDHDEQAGTATAEARKKQSGGSVEVHVGIAFFPDEQRSTEFIRSGRLERVERMLVTRLGTNIRHYALTMTWEEFTFSKAALSMDLIIKLTGLQPTDKVLLQPDGVPVPDTDTSDDVAKHYKYKVELRPDGIPKNELTEYDIEHFVNTALVSNPPDIHGLGIRLSQLGVTDVIPEGELKTVADLKAREQQERRGEEADFDTELALAQKYVKASKDAGDNPPLTLSESLELVRINRRPGNVREIILRGSKNPITDAAAIVGQTGGGNP